MGLVQGGELQSVIHDYKKHRHGLAEADAKFFAAGIQEGLAFLHRRGYVYSKDGQVTCFLFMLLFINSLVFFFLSSGDLKPENVLVSDVGEEEVGLVCSV